MDPKIIDQIMLSVLANEATEEENVILQEWLGECI